MKQVRFANNRGQFDHGWLKTAHTFSFGHYLDPKWTSFRSLRVMNEDFVAPGQGFGMHGHKDMEIVTIVLKGALEHQDSLGNGEVLRPGELQRMTAGTGIRHSEFNPSPNESTHLYQIWLLPEAQGLTPSYEQKAFPESQQKNQWQLVASRDGRGGALTIHQSAELYLTTLDAGIEIPATLKTGTYGWLQILKGEIQTDGRTLHAGDALYWDQEDSVTLRAVSEAQLLLFELN